MTDLSTIASLTATATTRAVGLCFDEVAVNTSILQELEQKRKNRAVLKVMGFSFGIKMLVIPAALALTAVAPGIIVPLLTVGGLHLAAEGVRHMREKHDNNHKKDNDADEGKNLSPEQVEKARIKKVLVIDGLLSVEITVMSLGVIAGLPALAAGAVLAATGALRTAGMYSVIAGILNIPRAAKWLEARKGDGLVAKAARGVGKKLEKSMPYIIKGFQIAGTLALLMIGGGLLIHGIPGGEHLMTNALGVLGSNPIVQGLAVRVVETVVGLGAGFVARPVMDKMFDAIGNSFKKGKELAQKAFKSKPKKQPAPVIAPPAPANNNTPLQNAPKAKEDFNKTPAAPAPAPQAPAQKAAAPKP